VANSQDESLVIFYSEVLAFSFFSSQDRMLKVPWTLLGARRYMGSITGESRRGEESCGFIKREDWLNNGILRQTVPVMISDRIEQIVPSAFVAVFSKSSVQDDACRIEDAQNNLCDAQRRHLDIDISLWFQAFHKSMYIPEVQEVFGSVVLRVGTGPWGAGLWFGDSQQYFLAIWLASSLLEGPGLEYYVYDHFCENPGNQCFLLGLDGCKECVKRGGTDVYGVSAANCGYASVHDVVARFRGRPAQELYSALNNVGPPPKQVFDHLAALELPERGQEEPGEPAQALAQRSRPW
jgi:hypothetical protein